MVGLFFHYDPLMVEIEVDRGAQFRVSGQAESSCTRFFSSGT